MAQYGLLRLLRFLIRRVVSVWPNLLWHVGYSFLKVVAHSLDAGTPHNK